MPKRKVLVPFVESWYGRPGSARAMLHDEMIQVVNEWNASHPDRDDNPIAVGLMKVEVDEEETK